MTTLFGWGPMFDTRGPSPFVLKADIQMQMLGVGFERANAVLEAVAKHKAPYVEIPRSSGSISSASLVAISTRDCHLRSVAAPGRWSACSRTA